MINDEGYVAVACPKHWTLEEHEHAKQVRHRYERRFAERWDRDPACWSWPVTTTHYRMVQEPDAEESAEVILLTWQQDRCAICGRELRRLETDHNHETGLVRGMLCRTCNILEGTAGREVHRRYQRRNPASMLGLVARYWTPRFGYAEPRRPFDINRSPAIAVSRMILGDDDK